MAWTQEQVLALAPDGSSAGAGRSLALPLKWSSLHCDPRAIWGECQGSGAKPYQVQVDLSEPAFKCTCPSRKFPCKHGVALLLMWAARPADFAASALPDWVREWLDKRDAKSQTIEAAPKEKTPEDEQKSKAAQARRAAERESRVAAGLEELDLWLKDMVRTGLSGIQSKPPRFWEEKAARLIDAQAPGLAQKVRDLAGIPASGEGWSARLLGEIGKIHLLIDGYRREAHLPENLQAIVRQRIGWTVRQEELLEMAGVADRWLVAGRRIYHEDRLTVQRTWLVSSANSGESACVFSFAAPGQSLDTSLIPGTSIEAELVYYPSASRMGGRAIVKCKAGLPELIMQPLPAPTDCWRNSYAEALALDPWLETFPLALDDATPLPDSSNAFKIKSNNELIDLSPSFQWGWKLIALSGGKPVSIFGEWNGRHLLPLSVVTEGRYVSLAAGKDILS